MDEKINKVYVSGPMTGFENYNFPAFEAAAKRLRDAGFEVVSPHELPEFEDYDLCLRADIAELVKCDAIVTLPGWQASRGARLETSVAIMVGIPVMSEEDAYTHRA